MPGARLDQQLQVQPLLGAAPGSFRSFAKSHPLNILYITTKITQKTTNFNGMSNVSQSIITFSFYLQFQVMTSYQDFLDLSTGNAGN